jgi:hypothetical protein
MRFATPVNRYELMDVWGGNTIGGGDAEHISMRRGRSDVGSDQPNEDATMRLILLSVITILTALMLGGC